MRIIVLSFLAFLLALSAFAASNLEEGVEELAQQISDGMENQNKTSIAVVEFADLNGNINAFGQFFG